MAAYKIKHSYTPLVLRIRREECGETILNISPALFDITEIENIKMSIFFTVGYGWDGFFEM